MFEVKAKQKTNTDMADFEMMNMLALYILSNEYDFVSAQDYAKRTMMYGNFTAAELAVQILI